MTINTKRLRLSPVQWETELDAYFSLASNAKVMQFIREPESDIAAYEQKMEKYKQHALDFPGLGLRSVYRFSDNQLIGNCILRYVDLNPKNNLEIGYVLDEPFWGVGYGTELAAGLCAYIQNELGKSAVEAFTEKAHKGSQGVLLKNGFKIIGEKYLEGDLCTHFLKTF